MQKNIYTLLLRILCFVIIFCLAFGFIFMLFDMFSVGVTMWGGGLFAGILILYIKRTREKKAEELARFEEELRSAQSEKE